MAEKSPLLIDGHFSEVLAVPLRLPDSPAEISALSLVGEFYHTSVGGLAIPPEAPEYHLITGLTRWAPPILGQLMVTESEMVNLQGPQAVPSAELNSLRLSIVNYQGNEPLLEAVLEAGEGEDKLLRVLLNEEEADPQEETYEIGKIKDRDRAGLELATLVSHVLSRANAMYSRDLTLVS